MLVLSKYHKKCIIFVLSKIMKLIGFLLLFCGINLTVLSQTKLPILAKIGKNDTIKTYATLDSGHMAPWFVLPEVKIWDTRIFKTQADRDNYRRLKYNVLKVLPYARFAGARYKQLQRDLALTADKKKQKQLVTACENQIKDLFNREIKEMTISQGEVLIKLIDRETGNTSYAMVKDLKGGFNAFILQSAARIFGHDLKETYDPDQQKDIEAILSEAGYISAPN